MLRFLGLVFVSFLLVACKNDNQVEAWDLVSSQTCDLHKESCSAGRGVVSLELDLGTKPVPIAKNFVATVNLAGIKPEKVELDITGVNMYMGFNRVTLKEVGEGVYQGSSMLAFCTNEKMIWQVGVLLHLEDGTKQLVPFELITTNR